MSFAAVSASLPAAALAAAKPWHYWISVILVISIVLGLVATVIGYYVKVTANKYPRQ